MWHNCTLISGCVYTTTISLVSAIISVIIVAVRPFVYTTTVKPFPVSANIRIRQRKRKNLYPGIFRRRVNSCSVVCLRWKKMDRRIIAAFLALLSTLIGIYSLAYKSIVLQSAYFLWKRQRLAHLALFSTRRRRQICQRRFWIRPGRTQGWWENFLQDKVLPVEWKENFRMQKHNFLKLCVELEPHIQKQETNMRKPISVQCQIAATLYYLSDEGRLRKTANAFGISRSAVSLIVRRVSKAIALHLGPKYIQLPLTEEAVKEKVGKFYTTFSVPQCLGAIDCTHVEIKQPSSNYTDYINRKGRYSLDVQACCDHDFCFWMWL